VGDLGKTPKKIVGDLGKMAKKIVGDLGFNKFNFTIRLFSVRTQKKYQSPSLLILLYLFLGILFMLWRSAILQLSSACDELLNCF